MSNIATYKEATSTRSPVINTDSRLKKPEPDTVSSISEQENEIISPNETISAKESISEISFIGLDEKIRSQPLFHFKEGERFTPWILLENISARVIDYYDDVVVLECLIDREAGIYDQRELKKSLFDGYPVEMGQLFKLCTYERKNEIMLQLKGNPKLVSEMDFPKIDFYRKYGENFFNLDS